METGGAFDSACSQEGKMTMKANERIRYLDVAKGLGIILVIIGHAFRDEMRLEYALCEFVYDLVYTFHMPLFFVVSGMAFGLTYRKYLRTPKEYVSRKTRTLLIPMVSYAMAMYCCFWGAYQIPAIRNILLSTSYRLFPLGEYVWLTLVQDNPYTVHIWYLWILFFISVIAYILLRFEAKGRPMRLLFVVGALMLYLVSYKRMLPIAVMKLFRHMIYFALGLVLSDNPQLLKSRAKLLNIGMVLGWLFAVAYSVLVACRYKFRLLAQPDILAVSKLLSNGFIVYSILRLSGKLKDCRPMLLLGEMSFSIYLLHQPFCCGFVGIILYNKLQMPAGFVFAICCLLSILFPMGVVAVCRKNRLIGKTAKRLLNIS